MHNSHINSKQLIKYSIRGCKGDSQGASKVKLAVKGDMKRGGEMRRGKRREREAKGCYYHYDSKIPCNTQSTHYSTWPK